MKADLLTAGDVAKAAGVSIPTIRNWCARTAPKGFPTHLTTPYGSRLWLRRDIEQWLSSTVPEERTLSRHKSARLSLGAAA